MNDHLLHTIHEQNKNVIKQYYTNFLNIAHFSFFFYALQTKIIFNVDSKSYFYSYYIFIYENFNGPTSIIILHDLKKKRHTILYHTMPTYIESGS